MKSASLAACIVLALMVALPAQARNGDDDFQRRPRAEQGRGQQGRFPPPQEFWRGRQDRPAAQEEDPRAKRRWLTPEERQELRRDIRDAGRAIYGPSPKRRFRGD